MAVTRFGLEGFGVRRAGSFAGKTADVPANPIASLTLSIGEAQSTAVALSEALATATVTLTAVE